jgi:hypothetical protein
VATGVQVQRTGRQGRVTGFVLRFSEALDAASAQNVQHYRLTVPGRGRKQRSHAVTILAAAYDPALHTVTLTIGRPRSTDRLGMLEVTGVTDAAGDGLSGSDLFVVPLAPRRTH